MTKANRVKRDLRRGKWMQDDGERQRLVEQITPIKEKLISEILAVTKLPSSKLVDHRAIQGYAFLELAALAALGVLSADNVDQALMERIRTAIDFQSSALQYTHDKTRVSAAILLIELAILENDQDYVPPILSAYPPREKFVYSELHNKDFWPDAGSDLNSWYFARLWDLMDDPRVAAYLITMLDEDMSPLQTKRNYIVSLPGPGYMAASMLLLNGDEKGIAATVQAALNPNKGMSPCPFIFEEIHTVLEEREQHFFFRMSSPEAPGTLGLISNHLVKALESDDHYTQIRATYSLAALQDTVALNTSAFPALLEGIAATGEGLFAYGKETVDSENTLTRLQEFWTPAPFLQALQHADKRVRLFAIQALSRLGDPVALEALKPLLEEEDRKLRKQAQKAIRKLQ